MDECGSIRNQDDVKTQSSYFKNYVRCMPTAVPIRTNILFVSKVKEKFAIHNTYLLDLGTTIFIRHGHG